MGGGGLRLLPRRRSRGKSECWGGKRRPGRAGNPSALLYFPLRMKSLGDVRRNDRGGGGCGLGQSLLRACLQKHAGRCGFPGDALTALFLWLAHVHSLNSHQRPAGVFLSQPFWNAWKAPEIIRSPTSAMEVGFFFLLHPPPPFPLLFLS